MSRTYYLGATAALTMLLIGSGATPVFAGGHWKQKTTTVTYAPVGQTQVMGMQYAPVQYQMGTPLTYSMTTAAPTLGFYYVQAAPTTLAPTASMQPTVGNLGSTASGLDADTVMLRTNSTYVRLSARLGEFNTRALLNELRSRLDQQVTTLSNAGGQATLRSINWASILSDVANVFFRTYFGTNVPSDLTDLINTVIQDVIGGKGLLPGGNTPAPAPAPASGPTPAPSPSANIPAGQVRITISNAVLIGTIESAGGASPAPTPVSPFPANGGSTNDGGQAAPKPTR